ncbi:galactose mutarotase-like protein [Rickenella mellea]|uniref:Galactose mutarotase-like protein n=1 Tax=Rickenella mellea TaxID=50990 RepID=A0A4R5XFU8_9AGAM|nr:galactose mutarotase-like protein [Rickenella mellea]
MKATFVLTLFASAGVLGAFSASLKARSPDPLEVVSIIAPDGSAKANFISFGATATNFWVKDKHGKFRDILLGFDNHTNYITDALGHPYFGPVVGRYANRIKNGTFSVPIANPPRGNIFHIPENENNGTDTLHGGNIGYDRRQWTIAKRSTNSVTYTLVDPDGTQGFPGTVHATAVYTLEKNSVWNIHISATATKKTPVMLSGHHYWNLEAYQETQNLDGHFAQFQSSRVIDTDGILVPNGKFIQTKGTPLDFGKAASIGKAIPATAPFQFCGTGCVGLDNCWIYDKNNGKTPAFSIWSVNSGIRLDVTTDQTALQLYTCNGIDAPGLPIPRKVDQGGPNTKYADHSCLVIEQESWIDAINNPQWGIDQIFGPQRDYEWSASYAFSVMK